ncbi:MAG: hypothetical protein R3C11_19380 [Planctomycetaceae bacterium]
MLTLINTILVLGTALLLIPFIVFCLECLAALLPWRARTHAPETESASVAVLYYPLITSRLSLHGHSMLGDSHWGE